MTSKSFSRLTTFLILALLVLPDASLTAEAATNKPIPAQTQKTAKLKLSAGMISAQDALNRIAVHMQTIQDRKTAMSDLYDYHPSVQTMTDAYRRNGANQWAIDRYAANAGQNGLYLTWDVVGRFYDAHLQALKDSAWEIKITKRMAPVPENLITYLDRGMAAWAAKEKEVAVRFQQYTERKAIAGSILGQENDLRPYKNNDPQAQARYENLESQSTQLNTIIPFLDNGLREIGYKTRLFSAINAPDRIGVTPPPEEANQCAVNQVPPPVDYFKIGQ